MFVSSGRIFPCIGRSDNVIWAVTVTVAVQYSTVTVRVFDAVISVKRRALNDEASCCSDGEGGREGGQARRV